MRMVVKVGGARPIPASAKSQALSRHLIPGCCPKAEVVLKACWHGCPLLHLCTQLQSLSARLSSRQSCWGRHGRIAFVLQQKIFDKYSDEFKKAKRRRKSIDSILGKRSRRSEEHEKMKRHHEDRSCKDWKIISADENGESRQEGNEDADRSLPKNRFHQEFSTLGHSLNSIATSVQENKVSPKKRERRKESRMVPEGTQPYAIDELLKIAELGLSEDLRNGDAGHQVLLLQRAMFLLGYLPDVSSLTGYFGSETRTAVGKFQHAHNISNTGLWDSRSRQALLKHLASFEENSGNMNRVSPPLWDYAKRGFQNGLWCWQTVQEPIKGLSELFASISCYRNTLYGQFCMCTLGLVAFVSIIHIGHSSISQMSQRQSVKKRILRSRWFAEGNSGIDRRRLLQRTKGQQLQNRSSPKNSGRENTHRYNGLVIHDGELVRNGFGAGMQKSSYPKYDQQTSSHQSAHISRPSAAFLLASVDQSYNPHRGEASQESKSAASDNTRGLKSEQANESFLGKVGSFFTKIFLVANQHSMHKINNSSSNGMEVIQGIAERQTRYPSIQETIVEPRTPSGSASIMADPQGRWRKEDELDLKDRIEELHKSVLAAEENRKAAMCALTEEKRRSLELEVKIRRQKEAAVALEEEVRVLKESHDTLLRSLRKKYSSSVSARAAAALLYQTWETTGEGSTQKESL